MRFALAAAAAALLTLPGLAEARTWRVAPGPEAQTELQRALNEIEPGDTLRLDRGRYELTQGLTLAVDRVTVRGDGQDRTVLSFAGQQAAGPGLEVRAHGVELRDFAVEDARGAGVAVQGCNGVTLRGLRAEWTRAPQATDNARGFELVDCSRGLVERLIARGAPGGGVVVMQSRDIIVRMVRAENNGTGIAILDTLRADVFENTLQGNIAGVMVVDMPVGQPTEAVRVFRNTITGKAGSLGVAVSSSRNVHVFENEIGDQGGVNVMIGSFRDGAGDAAYNPLPRDIMIRNNRFGAVGGAPPEEFAPLVQSGVTLPNVLWDGAVTYYTAAGPRNEVPRIVMRDNRAANGGIGTFLSLGLNVPGAPFSEAAPDPAYPPLLTIEEPERVEIDN